jgi:tRNA(Ile)-lysidine synthase
MATLSAHNAAHDRDFLAALNAGLPVHGFWSAPVVACVSGGADSVALLLGLHSLAAAQGAISRLFVAHARHDLREEAAADATFVTELAAGLGISCVVRDLQVREPDGVRGEGIEGRARRLRHEFFAAVAREQGARSVVVAHTADDQAETILHRSLRGWRAWPPPVNSVTAWPSCGRCWPYVAMSSGRIWSRVGSLGWRM